MFRLRAPMVVVSRPPGSRGREDRDEKSEKHLCRRGGRQNGGLDACQKRRRAAPAADRNIVGGDFGVGRAEIRQDVIRDLRDLGIAQLCHAERGRAG